MSLTNEFDSAIGNARRYGRGVAPRHAADVMTGLTDRLIYMDSWLSLAGQLPAIRCSRANLLRNTPVFCQHLMEVYDQSIVDGRGSKVMLHWNGEAVGALSEAQKLFEGYMEQLGISPAECIYLMVATCRALGVAICIGGGTDTSKALPLLDSYNIQAHMV